MGSRLPEWWPVAAVLIPVVFTVIVALIQFFGSIKAAKITAGAKAEPILPKEVIEQEVVRVLGVELDKRIGPQRMAEAQSAFEQGKLEAEESLKQVIESHQQTISQLQAQLAAKGAEQQDARPEQLAAAMLYNAGRDAHRPDNLGVAVGLYSAALQLDPTYQAAYYNRANAKYDLGDKQGAIRDYDEAIRLDPTDAKALYNCGNSKFDLGDYRGALYDYSEAVRIDPSFVNAYYNRGNAKAAMGQKEAAIADFEQVFKLDPTYSAAVYNIACEHAKAHEGEEALARLELAVKMDGKWARKARLDPDFEALHEHPGFRELVEG